VAAAGAVVLDRLVLKLRADLTPSQGRRLATLVAEGLGRAVAGAGAAPAVSRDAVRVEVAAGEPGEPVERLAERIVAETLRQWNETAAF
jgi:hypothetical protein